MEIEAMLTLAGHEAVALADDLDSAVAAATAERPDLALVDIQLTQGTSGLDVAKALNRLGIPVLFATGNCPHEKGRSLALGCLHKPITDRTLAAAIKVAESVLHGSGVQNRLPLAFHLY
ncbi:response regulator [Rubellimicrobium rubrum]|uniref:Response regulator n=2 Tax=Rubellimicrobium rubrum TaxID=2585369 RepID=A0A5C4N1L8_9RHOB|nr:response regulator [Rubellimicrobium rubrum]